MIDLVLKQLGRLVEQIDGDQPVRKPADHLVATPADWSELTKIVEQAKSFDRRQCLTLPA